jgi:hypothetical protein
MRTIHGTAAALAFALPAAPLIAADAVTLEVRAGAHDRSGTVVRAALPAGADPVGPWRLVVAEGGREVPVQILSGTPPAAVWILESPLAAGKSRAYRLEPQAPAAVTGVVCTDTPGKHLRFCVGQLPVVQYNYGVVPPPQKVEPHFARSGYLHPVWSPGGAVVSNDYPLNHKHHHGIWFPWTNTVYEGRKVDFWNMGDKKGKVEAVGLDATFDGPVSAGFRARHRFLDLIAPGGPKEALKETWAVTVWNSKGPFLFDLESVQTCAGASPLQLVKYHYGGMGFRGSIEWEKKEGATYLSSEGKTRADGNGTPSRWCTLSGKVGGATTTIVFYGHPANFRAPQHMRLHPDEPFFCYCPAVTGDFSIEPGTPYVSRYRFSVHDGAVTKEEAERIWRDYAEPLEAAAGK